MNNIYQFRMNVVNGIDLFTRKEYSELLIRAIRHYQKSYGLEVYTYAIMPDAAWLIGSQPEGVLREVIHSLKSYTSVKLIDLIQKGNDVRKSWMLNAFSTAGLNNPGGDFFDVWTGDNHWEPVTSATDFEQRLDYIHGVPVRAGIVEEPAHYRFSSAAGYGAGHPATLSIASISETTAAQPTT